jgi:starch synthase
MVKILMVGSEATPYAKTGGLADVLGSLPPALAALGHEVAVLLPRYRITRGFDAQRIYDELPIWLGSRRFLSSVYQIVDCGVRYLLLECPELYDRDGLYFDHRGDFADNFLRFAVFSMGALAVARHIYRPQVIHCHDWQAGLVPAYLAHTYVTDPTYMGIRTLFTVHNLGYQGVFGREILRTIGLPPSAFAAEGLEFYGDISYLKAGLWYADCLSTVSRRYAQEIQSPEFGFGMDGLLRHRSHRLVGILNGADFSKWNPATDPYLPAQYSDEDLSGKAVCKARLLEEMGLPPEAAERPLIGIISRFTGQKGFDLVEHAAEQLMRENVTIVALGSGEPHYEQLFYRLADRYPGKIAVRVAFDEGLAHRIEAGSDMFLMPSRYEPCGLNQIYSLRYGTIPVVRATGGLDDTIDQQTGFKFEGYSAAALIGAIREALAAYADPDRWKRLMLNGMRQDYSWEASARQYAELYSDLIR